jgi:hypothetical protein
VVLIVLLAALPFIRDRLRGPGMTITRRLSAGAVVVDTTITVDRTRGGLPDSTEAAARSDSAWGRIIADGAETWIDDVIAEGDSLLHRWPVEGTRLVRLWLADGREVPNWDAGFPAAVEDGFDAWNPARLPVRFLFVADSSASDVVVRFVQQLQAPAVGLTNARAMNDTIVSAVISIATTRSDNRPLAASDIQRTAVHEAGHLLGLTHSTDSTSIMAPLSRANAPNARDLATAALLYRLPFGSVRSGGRRPPLEPAPTPTPTSSP